MLPKIFPKANRVLNCRRNKNMLEDNSICRESPNTPKGGFLKHLHLYVILELPREGSQRLKTYFQFEMSVSLHVFFGRCLPLCSVKHQNQSKMLVQ